MSNSNHYNFLKEGKDAWNMWMDTNWKELATIEAYSDKPLRNNRINQISLTVADLSDIDLRPLRLFEGFNFKRVLFNNGLLSKLRFKECDFSKAHFQKVDLREVIFENCVFESSNFVNANLNHATFINCRLEKSNLSNTSLHKTSFISTRIHFCNLMWAKLIDTRFESSSIKRCRVYGASIWNVEMKDTSQSDLLITQRFENEITVDSLEIAQILYLMIFNSKIKTVIENLTSKIILILGRFTENRKPVLESIKDRLRKLGYIPVIFDFEKPSNKSYIETVLIISQLSRFIIADFSDSKTILQEITKITDNSTVIIIPIIDKVQREPTALYDAHIKSISILNTYKYSTVEELLGALEKELLPQAEMLLNEIRLRLKNFNT